MNLQKKTAEHFAHTGTGGEEDENNHEDHVKSPTEIKFQWKDLGACLHHHPPDPCFAFLDPEFTICHKLVSCKDIMLDVAIAHFHGRPLNYPAEFSYVPDRNPKLTNDRTRFIWVLRGGEEDKKMHLVMLEKMHDLEKNLGIVKSVDIYRLEENQKPNGDWKDKVFLLIEGDRAWQSSPVMLSLFITCLRLPSRYPKNTFDEVFKTTEVRRKRFETLLHGNWRNELGDDPLKTYPMKNPGIMTHGHFGIYKFISY